MPSENEKAPGSGDTNPDDLDPPRLYGSHVRDELDAAQFRAAAEVQLTAFTRGLTEELITRLRETAQADPKSPWLRRMLIEGRKP